MRAEVAGGGDLDAVERARLANRSDHVFVHTLIDGDCVPFNNRAAGTTPGDWRGPMVVNLDGAFSVTRALIDGMRERRWGRIVNVCSIPGKMGGATASTAYKAGLQRGHFRSLERSPARSRAGAESRPPMSGRRWWPPKRVEERQRPASLALIPVGRCCDPEEVAERTAYLMSPHAGFTTREIVDIRGDLRFGQQTPFVERITPAIDSATELAGLFGTRGKAVFVPDKYGGIGEIAAWALALAGVHGTIAGRNANKVEALAKARTNSGLEADRLLIDVECVASIRRAVDAAAQGRGRVDALLNRVGT